MKQMSALIVLAVLITAGPCAGLHAQTVGHVIYLSGDPIAVRAARRFWPAIGPGTALQPFDFLETTADELLEIETDDAIGVRAMVRMQPHSALYLELLADVPDGQRHAVRLLSGAVSVRMRDPDPRARLEVVTAATRVTGAGAEYDVTIAADGAVLVTVARGTARVSDPRGRSLFADVERAVEHRPDGTFRSVPLTVGRSDRFRSVWRDQIEANLRFDAAAAYRLYAGLYLEQLPHFQDTYLSLMGMRHVLDRWMEADRQGRDPQRVTEAAAAELDELASYVEAVRDSLRRIETSWYQLQQLSRFAAAGAGPLDTAVAERLTVSEFFERLADDARIVEDQMHTARYVIGLHARRAAARHVQQPG
ncbi:MAG: hypothetical protein EA384_14905 [Spirochaetaceae bacterium]|nr:MAG: hypothetical protein EA384_14905 [Spirochaetaceae bacterium]